MVRQKVSGKSRPLTGRNKIALFVQHPEVDGRRNSKNNLLILQISTLMPSNLSDVVAN